MFRLSIVTPEQVFFEEDVQSLVVPGTEGYLGVLSNHAPLISALKPGRVEIRDAEEKVHFLSVTNGFIEVSKNVATILCDAAEFATEIDIERAEKAKAIADGNIKKVLDGSLEFDLDAEKAALERAKNRIKIAKEKH